MNENLQPLNDQSDIRSIAVRRSTSSSAFDAQWAGPADSIPTVQGGVASVLPYLHVLRRHWLLAICLGLSCAIVASCAVWFGVGATYTSTSMFQIATRQEVRVFREGEQRFTVDAYEIYKATQAQLIKSPFVVSTALKDDAVRRLRLDKREYDPNTWLADEIEVRFLGKGEIMTVGITSRDPMEAMILARAVTNAYMQEEVNAERNERLRKISELDIVRAEKDSAIRERRSRLRQLAENFGSGDPEALAIKQQTMMRQLADYQREYMRLDFQLRTLKGTYEAQKAMLDNIDTLVISDAEIDLRMQSDPVGRQLAQELMWRQLDLEHTKQVVGEGNGSRFTSRPMLEMQTAQLQYQQVVDDIRERIRAAKSSEIAAEMQQAEIEIVVMGQQLPVLAGEVTAAEEELSELGGSTIDMEMRQAEIEQLSLVLDAIAKQKESLEVEQGSPSRIRLRRSAEEPPFQSGLPARIALTILGALAGFVAPVLAIAWWGSRSRVICSSDDIPGEVGLTLIGSLPIIPARVIGKSDSLTKRQQGWNIRLIESVDNVAARLLHQSQTDNARVIMVSSAVGGEGKTTLATQLGMSLARNGRRTVVVDCDLRKPALHGVFGLPVGPGVSDVLRGDSDAMEVIHPTAVENLSVVAAGAWDRKSMTALANGAAGLLLGKLREQFDFVVVDTSPILPVADTRFVSQHIDVAVLSVFRDISQSPKVSAACEILEAFGVRTIDAVFVEASEVLRGKDMRYEPQPTA